MNFLGYAHPLQNKHLIKMFLLFEIQIELGALFFSLLNLSHNPTILLFENELTFKNSETSHTRSDFLFLNKFRSLTYLKRIRSFKRRSPYFLMADRCWQKLSVVVSSEGKPTLLAAPGPIPTSTRGLTAGPIHFRVCNPRRAQGSSFLGWLS